jgi:hypothetical protein
VLVKRQSLFEHHYNLRGIPTIVDTNIESDDHIFYGATFLKLNHEEANGLCPTENEDLSIKCKNVCEQFKAQVSMIMMLGNPSKISFLYYILSNSSRY